MGNGGWAMITIIPTDLFTGFSEEYVVEMLGSLLVTMIIFGVFSVFLYYGVNKNRENLEKLAYVDEVTGGNNKAEFRLKYERLKSRKIADQFAIILMDSADFQLINEIFGRKNGDKMLAHFYRTIDAALQKERDEFVARTEMDHFFLCMREREDRIIRMRLEQIVQKINTCQSEDIPQYKVMFRQAVAYVTDNEKDVMVFQDQARLTLKFQDRTNKEYCAFYDENIAVQFQKGRELERIFPLSIRREDFQVYMQPKVSLKEKRVVGAEALVRWECPGLGMISPSDFIPLLEGNGQIRVLDKYMFAHVCAWMKKWQEEGNEMFPVSINLSRSHFLGGNFIEEFARIAESYGVKKEWIEFELTENIFLEGSQIQKVKQGIEDMHRYGFRCSLDDFGVGFSALTLLKEFKIDTLKLDRSFFQDIHNKKTRYVVASVAELAEKLRIDIVVEGIETEEQIYYLQPLHCDVVQGYYFSRPLPLDEFACWINKFNFYDYFENKENKENNLNISGGGTLKLEKKMNQETERRSRYLDNMPVACCEIKVLLDAKGNPCDFTFLYTNKAHAKLEGTREAELIGENFYQFFPGAEKVWLNYYYETAFLGVSHVIKRYCRAIKKHLTVYTFPLEKGCCGCVLIDTTEEVCRKEELERSQEILRKEAQLDSLTGVLNAGTGRKLIEHRLNHKEPGYYNAIFLMDIDDFKKINDSRGHMTGDEVLKSFALLLKETFFPGDVVYRLGGDEFVVFVENMRDPDKEVEVIMNRFFKNLREKQNTYPYLSSSVGIYVTNEEEGFIEYYQNMDKALYITKKEGKNHFTVIKKEGKTA